MSGIPANVYKLLGYTGTHARERVPNSSTADISKIQPWEQHDILAPGVYCVPGPGAPANSPQNK
jgi:hypothetical protein